MEETLELRFEDEVSEMREAERVWIERLSGRVSDSIVLSRGCDSSFIVVATVWELSLSGDWIDLVKSRM